MIIILILLLIPIFFTGVTIYTSTLYGYMLNNELDTVLLLIGLFVSLISSFILFKSFILIDKEDYLLYKLHDRIDSIIGVISCTLLFLFGISLIVNSTLHEISYSKILIGSAIVLSFIFTIYYYFISSKVYNCKVIEIEHINKKFYCITLDNKELGIKEYYVKDKKDIKKNKTYKCFYSPGSKIITKIIGEVVEVK